MKPIINERPLSIAMLGMVEGNGHPYSWSAIFNGYDPAEMSRCPYPVIAAYLDKQPKASLQIPQAKVTHIWTDQPQDAVRVARAAHIPNIVPVPEEVIGAVDAVIVSSDFEHVERCRPFVEAGLPIFVDKPLVANESELRQFQRWIADGAQIMSSSCMRYCKEFAPYRLSTHDLGELRFISITMPKTWEQYGIHALEAVYPIVGPGFISVRNTGTYERNIVHCKHRSGIDIVIAVGADMIGSFGMLQLGGTQGCAQTMMKDTFYAFKTQLAEFVQFVRTGGMAPYPFDETVELMQVLLAGIRSRNDGGREVRLTEIEP